MQSWQPAWAWQRAAAPASLLASASRQQRPSAWLHQETRRPPTHPHRPPSSARHRSRQKRQGDVPLYDIPIHVLDLDAENSLFVRPYDEAIAADETARWRNAHASIDALQARLAAFEDDADRADARMRAVAASPTPWRVTDRDILSVALRGGGHEAATPAAEVMPKTSETPEELVIGELAYQNGISTRAAADPDKLARALQHRRRRGLSAGKRSGFPTTAAFLDALSGAKTFTEVRRLALLAAGSPMAAMAANSPAVVRGWPAMADRISAFLEPDQADPTAAEAVSTLLLNLAYSFASQGTDVGRDLCRLGLRAAAMTGEPAAMQRFLRIGLSGGYFAPEDAADAASPDSAVLQALSAVNTSLQQAQFRGTGADLFTLLTGRSSLTDATMTAGEASFRAAVSADPRAREAYHALLADMGCVRTLWEEQQSGSSEVGETGKAGEAGEAAVVDADTLVTAVLRYAGCMEKLGRLWGAQAGPVVEVPEGRGDEVDLWMMSTCEKVTDRQPQPQPSLVLALATLRPKATQLPLLLLRGPTASAAASYVFFPSFRDGVAAAFAQSSLGAVMDDLDALLRLHRDTLANLTRGGGDS